MIKIGKGAKYIGLTTYLRECGQDRVTFTFEEIANLGAKLPPSAYKWQALWSNGSQGSLSFGWLKAGYLVSSISLDQEIVEFIYDPSGVVRYLEAGNARGNHKPPTVVTNEDIGYYTQRAMEYFETMKNDMNSRFRSWEHCYFFFSNNRRSPNEQTLDLLSLHLAWYLASWGMLRGRAFLLQKDYKVHLPIVKLLTSERISRLYCLSIEDLCREETAKEIMTLSDEIVALYEKETRLDESSEGNIASETLVSKIILGTIGCVPAYDRYFKQALRNSGIAVGAFSQQSLLQLAEFYHANKDEFEICRKEISASGVEYPPMKVVDMCFWQVGFNSENDVSK